jgi:RNA polymerase sigma-70 factor (ECF subfamily)
MRATMIQRNRRESGGGAGDDEHDLIERAKRDPEAFAPLYSRYFEAIHRYTYRRLDDQERAADATSQVFLKALTNLNSFKSGSFQSWLYTIARNVVIDSIRRTKPQTTLPELWEVADAGPTPEEQALENDARQQLSALLDVLNPEQRSVVEFRLAGMTGQEIADRLGRTVGAVKMIQWRAFQRLREEMREPTPIASEYVESPIVPKKERLYGH